ncbi:MAG: hypothetical protein WBC18_14670 [Ottowia sp.]|uniref:hypothetical protein n=1 Tax=Ottowia sp. TaxID=1898956 RepID=UPI003C75E23E
MSAVTAFIVRLGVLIGLLLAFVLSTPVLSGPSDTDAARATEDSLQDAVAQAKLEHAALRHADSAQRVHRDVYALLNKANGR